MASGSLSPIHLPLSKLGDPLKSCWTAGKSVRLGKNSRGVQYRRGKGNETDLFPSPPPIVMPTRCRVSNFSVKNLEVLLAETSIVPAVNQVEANIYHPQSSLHTYCSDKGIHLTAYCPLGQPKGDAGSAVLKEPLLKELADKYGKPLGSVSLEV